MSCSIDDSMAKLRAIALTFHTEKEYLHGGCYVFAKAAVILFSGELFINRQLEHCVVKLGKNLYDIHGKVSLDGFRPLKPGEEEFLQACYFLRSPKDSYELLNKILYAYSLRG